MSQFNEYASTYETAVADALGVFAKCHGWALQRKADVIGEYLRQGPMSSGAVPRVLDIGCGIVLVHHRLRVPCEIHGIDVSENSIAVAREAQARKDVAEKEPRRAASHYLTYDGRTIPFADDSFDLVFASCMFHHVPIPEHPALAREMVRVTRRRGTTLIFEHNPWNPATQFIFRNTALDADARMINHVRAENLLRNGSGRTARSRSILLTPFQGSVFRVLEKTFARLPVGAQYYSWIEK